MWSEGRWRWKEKVPCTPKPGEFQERTLGTEEAVLGSHWPGLLRSTTNAVISSAQSQESREPQGGQILVKPQGTEDKENLKGGQKVKKDHFALLLGKP
jgi:hypothetical protein